VSQQHLKLSECKRCGKPIAIMKKPEHTSQETFDRFSGICQLCFSPEEQAQLHLAMKNDMFKNLNKQKLIV